MRFAIVNKSAARPLVIVDGLAVGELVLVGHNFMSWYFYSYFDGYGRALDYPVLAASTGHMRESVRRGLAKVRARKMPGPAHF